jgi:hypothetical protein
MGLIRPQKKKPPQKDSVTALAGDFWKLPGQRPKVEAALQRIFRLMITRIITARIIEPS